VRLVSHRAHREHRVFFKRYIVEKNAPCSLYALCETKRTSSLLNFRRKISKILDVPEGIFEEMNRKNNRKENEVFIWTVFLEKCLKIRQKMDLY
jgi:hypothetical protein